MDREMGDRDSREDLRKRSNHHIPPQPVKMTRSGVDLINELLESPSGNDEAYEEEEERRGRRTSYQGNLRRDEFQDGMRQNRSREGMRSHDRMSTERMPSRDRISNERMPSRDRMSSERMPSRERLSYERMPSQERLSNGRMTSRERMSADRIPSGDLMNMHGEDDYPSNAMSFHGSREHYGNRADDLSRRASAERLNSAILTSEEQAYFRERAMLAQEARGMRRSRHGTVEMEEGRKDEELKRKAKRAWGRPAWHPLTILRGSTDKLRSSKGLLLLALVFVLLALGIVAILTYFLWPRAVTINFVSIEHDTTPMPYRVIPKEGGVHLRLQSWIVVKVRNPNYFEAKIKNAKVIANWLRLDGSKEMFGGSIIDSELQLGKRGAHEMRLPVTIEYMGVPETDPIYSDFLHRCYSSPEGEKNVKGEIGMEWEVQVNTEAKGQARTGTILVQRTMACPIGQDMIESVLQKLKKGSE